METNNITILGEKTGSSLNGHRLKNTFSDYGNEISEIISHRPPLIVRWGTVYFLILILLIAVISWYIQYPDIVVTRAKLNCLNAPKQVVPRTEGKLISILVKENEMVKAGQELGNMETIAHPPSVKELEQIIDTISVLVNSNRTDEMLSFSTEFNERFNSQLGELQLPFQTFMQSYNSFREFLHNGYFLRKKKMLQADLSYSEQLNGILHSQKQLLQQDVSLSNETFSANESLAKEKVISSFDYRNEKSKLISKQLTVPQINAAIVSNEALQNEKKKEIAELENQIIVQKNSFIQALQTLKSQVAAWDYKFILRAPVDGNIAYIGFIQEKQEVKSGQPLFYIQPPNSSYYVEITIPQYNFGKVKQGQDVLLKFQAYPFEQYGSVVGTVTFINSLPTDSGYIAKVQLKDGLITTYKKNLPYRNGLMAEADIVTDNLRLLERFYYNLSKTFQR